MATKEKNSNVQIPVENSSLREPSSSGTNSVSKYIIYGIIIIVIGLVLYKIFNVLFNNPLTSAISDIAGEAALLLSDFIGGCSTQSSCQFSEKNTCEKNIGCGWDAGKNCVITSGKSAGQGGFFSPSCGFGIFLIVGIIAFLLVKLVGIIRGTKSKTLKDVERVTGDKDTVSNWRERVDIAEAKANENDEKDNKELTLEARKTRSKIIGHLEELKMAQTMKDLSSELFMRANETYKTNIETLKDNYKGDNFDELNRDAEDATDFKPEEK